MKKINYEPLVGRFIVPISKDLDSKSEVKELIVNCDTRAAKMKNKKWVLLRKLTKDDIKSLDFLRYLNSFKRKNIVRLEKL